MHLCGLWAFTLFLCQELVSSLLFTLVAINRMYSNMSSLQGAYKVNITKSCFKRKSSRKTWYLFSFELSVFLSALVKHGRYSPLDKPSLCCTFLPFDLQPWQGKQSIWLYRGLAVPWNIDVSLMCNIKMRLCVCVCVCVWNRLPGVVLAVACSCQQMFFLEFFS